MGDDDVIQDLDRRKRKSDAKKSSKKKKKKTKKKDHHSPVNQSADSAITAEAKWEKVGKIHFNHLPLFSLSLSLSGLRFPSIS